MSHRPFTRRQAVENDAFLEALRETGNARLAARGLAVHRATYTRRRARDAAFAARWDAALAAAHAAFHLAGGTRAPEPHKPDRSSRAESRSADTDSPNPLAHLRTRGGEPTIVRTASGRLQLRVAPPGRMNAAAERRFLHALAATANVRLSAAAAGFAHSSFYARARKARPFAREMRGALEMAYDRLEWSLLQSAIPYGDGVAAWRHDEPAPVPPMSADQMLQLLFLHEKSVRQSWEKPHRRKRRGEPWETYTERLRAMWVAEKAREAEEEQSRRHARRRAECYETSGDWRLEGEAAPPELPPLELVTGWSKADPKKRKHDPGKALFGGWRLADWQKRKRDGG
jgi:hypothetical protein